MVFIQLESSRGELLYLSTINSVHWLFKLISRVRNVYLVRYNGSVLLTLGSSSPWAPTQYFLKTARQPVLSRCTSVLYVYMINFYSNLVIILKQVRSRAIPGKSDIIII